MATTTNTTMHRFNHTLASLLDDLANLVGYVASLVTPITGAGVSYAAGESWHWAAFKEGGSYVVQVGGYELAVDL